MTRSILRSVCSLALFTAAGPAGANGQSTFVIPPSFENVCATGQTSAQPFPFATAPLFNLPYRYQQAYDASVFPAVAPGDKIRISEIRFRIDEFSGTLTPITYSDITVNLSTTTLGVLELATGSTADLDSNLGADQTNVFSGGFDWDACGTPDTCALHNCADPDTTPAPFDQAIPFSSAFDYDPTQGNLLLEVFDLDSTPQQQLFDAADVPNPVTARVREVIGNDMHMFPTNFPDVGLVTQFVYTVVPEPGASMLAAIAALALAGLRRARS